MPVRSPTFRDFILGKVAIFMCKGIIVAAIVFLISSSGWSQSHLYGNIGLTSQPKDSDSICPITQYLGTFDMDGLNTEQTVYDFTLYDRQGNPLTLSNVLKQKKPVLLISGSYTCPIFRSQVPVINQVVRRYGDQINIYIVYTFEAHPVNDEQPYGDNVTSDNSNQQANIQYRQPKTYGDRLSIADSMLKSMEIDAPIIFDGPCNEWATHFGPAPNNAYLIDTNGVVFSKHPWFNRSPNDIIAEIASMLGEGSGNISKSDSGIFSFYTPNNFTVSGTNGETLEVGGYIMNESNADAIVNIVRIHSDLPSDWQSSLCSNVCFSTTIDSTSVRILSHSSQQFKLYFYTGKNAGHGNVTLQLSNANIPTNKQTLIFQASTAQKLSAPAINTSDLYSIKLFPNPVKKTLKILTALPYAQIRILNELGEIVFQESQSDSHDMAALPAGMYCIQLLSSNHTILGSEKFVKE